MSELVIEDVRTIITAPEGINLVVVKIETSEPELYGLGCATFTQRPLVVKSAVDNYLKPFLIGKDSQKIEDIWQSAMVSAYWRNGPVLNNAVSGIDMALWDIKGKLAGLPVYQLLGGKCREAASVYCHVDGQTPAEVEENARKHIEKGYRYIRCQMGLYGGEGHELHQTDNPPNGSYYDPKAYRRSVISLFEHLREKLGSEIELLHDIHERVAPIDALRLAKELEPYDLFFLEDPLAPEQIEWLKKIRQQSATPIAMGELFNNPNEWKELVVKQLIDFVRIHLSQIGGITPAKKLASFCEQFGVRTAWHGPGDVSPIGHAANVHLDVSTHNFGIQEWTGLSPKIREVFPGAPKVKDGYVYPNDKPGLGIDIDEEKAAQYPPIDQLPSWTLARTPDGTSVKT